MKDDDLVDQLLAVSLLLLAFQTIFFKIHNHDTFLAGPYFACLKKS
jgi:hypothetical protein